MKKILISTIAILFIFVTNSYSGGNANFDGDKYLLEIKEKLDVVLKQFRIDTPVIISNDKLTAQFNTNNFMLHSIYKTGYINPEAYEKLGPNHNGFLVEVSLHDGKYVGAADIPIGGYERTELYWKSFVITYEINNNQYVWIKISYGHQTNKELIKAIKECFGPILNSVDYKDIPKNRVIQKTEN